MAIDTLVPLANSVIAPGDTISFIVDDTYTAMQILVTMEAGSEYAYDGALGGAQAGYTVTVTNSGGRDTFVIGRDVGWNLNPQPIAVTEDETGSSATTTTNYYLTTEALYPQSTYPYNAITQGTLILSEDDVVKGTDVGQIDFDDASFNITDLGNGKTHIENIDALTSVKNPSLTSTDNALVTFDSTTGLVVQDSVIIGDPSTGDLSGVGSITLSGTVDGIDIATDVAANTAKVTNATHTGDVTGDTALTIAAKAVDVAMLNDGTDGELITWDASGVATTVAVGTATHVLTSNGVGLAPTFQAGGGGGAGGLAGAGSYLYDTTTTGAGTPAGDIRFNNATITSATTAFIADSNNQGIDISAAIPQLEGWRVSWIKGDGTVFGYADIGLPVDNTTYFDLPLTNVVGDGTITNNDELVISLVAPTLRVGDTEGPASSTDNSLARFDSTTGKLLQDSGAGTVLDDSGNLTIAGTVDGRDVAADGAILDTAVINDGTTAQDAALLTERADHVNTPAAGTAELWVRNDATQTIVVTDDAGTDRELVAGPASSTDSNVAIFNSTSGKLLKEAVAVNVSTTGQLALGGTASQMRLYRQTTGPGALANFGYVWLQNTTPTSLMFTDSSGNKIQVAGGRSSITLGAAVTTFAQTTCFMEITGDGGANTIATITGAHSGQQLVLQFVDALVTITDDNTHAADSIDLSAAFTSADDTILQLIYDGTSWYEVSRSVN